MQSITARNCISQSISYILITIDRRIDDSKGSPRGLPTGGWRANATGCNSIC